MYRLETLSMFELSEKEVLSTANQSKIIMSSCRTTDAQECEPAVPMNEADDILSIKSLFAKGKSEDATTKNDSFLHKREQSFCGESPPDRLHLAEGAELVIHPLIPVLQSIFGGERPQIDECITNEQLKVLLLILRRKCGRKNAFFDKYRSELIEEVNMLTEKLLCFSLKRTEENNKFVFKQALKLVKARLHSIPTGHLANEPNLSPKETNSLQKFKSFPSLSLPKLNTILNDELFKRQFKEVLIEPSIKKSLFFKHYFIYLNTKIHKLVQKWEKEFREKGSAQEVIQNMSRYFLTHNQCKLPWTYYEVINAVECFIDSAHWPYDPNATSS